jgi:hypothetical protein
MKLFVSCLLTALLLLGLSLRADTLELKDGTVLTGKYLGGSADNVRFETSAGLQIIDYSRVKNMSVDSGAAAAPAPTTAPAVAAPAPAAMPAPAAPAAAPSTATLPAGTVLLVRMMDSVSSRSAQGANFATKLAYDLTADGVVVVKAGTLVYGKVHSATQAGRAVGRSTLDIRLAQIALPGGAVPISTSAFRQAGDASMRKVARSAGVGAVIGNNTGNGSSGDGAAWGAGIAMLKPGQTLTIPPGALVEFTLTQPVSVTFTR